MTLNLVTTCDLVTILQRTFYNIKAFDLVTLCDLVTVFVKTKCVTKSRLHCTYLYVAEYNNFDSKGPTIRIMPIPSASSKIF